MKFHILLILVLALSYSAFAQINEYGKPGELKNLTKIHVDTGADANVRNLIVETIEKSGVKNLVFVDTPEESEIGLIFVSRRQERINGAMTTTSPGTNNSMTMIGREKISVGKGLVVLPNKQTGKLRLLMNFESAQDKYFEKKPEVKFAKEFVKAYKIANGLK